MVTNQSFNPQPRYTASMPVFPNSRSFQAGNIPPFIKPAFTPQVTVPALPTLLLPAPNNYMQPPGLPGNTFKPDYPSTNIAAQNNPAGGASNPAGTPSIPINGKTILISAAGLAGLVLAGLGIHKAMKKDDQQPKNAQSDAPSKNKPGNKPPTKPDQASSGVDSSSGEDSELEVAPAASEEEPSEPETDESNSTDTDTTTQEKSPTLKRLKKLPGNKDFSKKYKELTRIDFSGQDLSNANFKGMVLTECNFDDANLDHASFENAEIDACSFKDTSSKIGRNLFPKGLNTKNATFYGNDCYIRAENDSGGSSSGARACYGSRRKDEIKTA